MSNNSFVTQELTKKPNLKNHAHLQLEKKKRNRTPVSMEGLSPSFYRGDFRTVEASEQGSFIYLFI